MCPNYSWASGVKRRVRDLEGLGVWASCFFLNLSYIRESI